jgi:hypothetical protein
LPTISIPGPATFYVRWGCRRCGHTGGFAKTTVPIVTKEWTEPMVRNLLDALRLKLVKVHMKESVEHGRPCIPTPSDFHIERGVPSDAKIAGLI